MPDARAEYERQLELHLSTWGPHCGAPRAVYAGHLNKLLEAHAAMVRAEGYRAGLEAAANEAERHRGLWTAPTPGTRIPVCGIACGTLREAIRELPVPKEQS